MLRPQLKTLVSGWAAVMLLPKLKYESICF